MTVQCTRKHKYMHLNIYMYISTKLLACVEEGIFAAKQRFWRAETRSDMWITLKKQRHIKEKHF